MALLLRRGALDAEMVKHTFYYWIDNYYDALQAHIAARQARDPLVWRDFPALVNTMRAMQVRQVGRPLPKANDAKTAAFLAEEQTETA